VKKILVKGPALSASGYGEQCRFALRALRDNEHNFDIFLENINWGHTGMIPLDDEDRQWIDYLIGKAAAFRQQGGTFDISLQVTIPNEWDTKLAPYNVGFTAGIETSKVAPQWLNPCNAMDKILVVSNHAKYGIINTKYQGKNEQTGEEKMFGVDTPVEVCHYPVRKVEVEKLDIELTTDFNFLSVCQWGIRKDLESTVVSFMEEFHDEEVGLVLKTNVARNNVADKQVCQERLSEFVSQFPNHKCKIYLLHGSLSSGEMASLYVNPKIQAFVSTTHGEGFGLPLFEAAYSGLPILAPNWSGHVDFLYAPVKDKTKGKIRIRPHFRKIDFELKTVQPEAVWNGVIVADSRWCFVKRFSVRNAMRDVYKNIEEKRSIAKKLQKHVLKEFAEQEMFDHFADSIHEFDNEWESEVGQVAEA